jgi:hypothetical protein
VTIPPKAVVPLALRQIKADSRKRHKIVSSDPSWIVHLLFALK